MLQHDKTNNKFYFYGNEVDVNRYNEIRAILDEMPTAPQGHFFILTGSLEWELLEYPYPDPDIDDAELLNILMGGAE